MKEKILTIIENLKIKFVSFLDNYTDYCWGELIWWAMFPESHPIWLDAGKCTGCGWCGKNKWLGRNES